MIPFLTAAVSLYLLAQGLPLKYPYDPEFGGIGGSYPSASILWAYKLVDAWTPDDPQMLTGEHFRSDALPALKDLLARMDRPIVKEIALGMVAVNPKTPPDELAAGVALWTVAFKESVLRHPADRYYILAETVLKRAARDCDLVGKSFASLALAYCHLRDTGFPPHSGDVPVHGLRLERWHRSKVALARIGETFYKGVPARSLRAASEIAALCYQQGLFNEANHWCRLIKKRFPCFRNWGSYEGAS